MRCASTASTSTTRSPRAPQLEDAAAYLELHIEQGPVLESMDLPLGAVLGTFGVERYRIIWRGQAAHAGSTPMDQRRDALAGAAKLALELREIAKRVGGGAVLTSGGVVCKPGIVTSVVETAEQLLDMRHLDAEKLASMWEQVREACERFAQEEQLEVEYERIWEIEPILFDETLVGFADEAIREVAGTSHQPAERAAARRRRGLARRRSDRDDLRPEPPRPLAHEARGHEARAPRAGGPGARPARGQDDRPGRVRLSAAPSPPAAVVFDCDGLLLETESCWSLAEAELFARYGKVFGDDDKRVLIGTSAYAGSRVLERLLEQPGRAEPLGLELLELVERRLLEEAAAFPGAEALVQELKGRVPIAVASNTPQRLVRGALACAGLEQYFDVVVTADQVAEPKPSPDVYLRACELLGAAPSRSVGLEDSPTGVAAAARGGDVRDRDPVVSGRAARRSGPRRRLARRSRVRAALGLTGTRRASTVCAQRKRTAATPAATSAIPSSRPGVTGSRRSRPSRSGRRRAMRPPARRG